MTSPVSFVIFGCLMVAMIVQSVPIRLAPPEKILSSLTKDASKTVESTTTSPLDSIQSSDFKKKRSLNNVLDDDDSNEHDTVSQKIMHSQIRETSAQLHDNVKMNTDNSKVFTDVHMSSDDLINFRRRRSNAQFNQRRKRALLFSDDFEPFYESLNNEQQQFLRPSRAFAPRYWYPLIDERRARASYSEPYEWNPTIEDENLVPLILNEDDDDDEYDRYPVLFDLSDIPYANLQLQQEYNTHDLPVDDVDDLLYTLYEPDENNYFK